MSQVSFIPSPFGVKAFGIITLSEVLFEEDGITVIVKVTGVPLQPVPEVTKLPNESGDAPTVTVSITAFVKVLITKTEL